MLLAKIISLFLFTLKITGSILNPPEPKTMTFDQGKKAEFTEASQKTADFIEKIFEFQELDQVTMFAASLKDFVTIIGPSFLIFSSILSFLLPNTEDQWHDYISQQFQYLHERFNRIELQLANVIRLIKTEVFNSLYEAKRQRTADVRYALTTFFHNPSITNLVNARAACNSESTNPMTMLRHFYDRIVQGIPAAGQLSFTDMLTETVTEYNYPLLKRWAGQVFSDVLETALLRSQCLSLENETNFNYEQKKTDAEEVTNMTRQIGMKLDDMLVNAMRNFSIQQLERDVRRNLTNNQSLSDILANAFTIVTKKYSYFDWYVFIWQGNDYHLSTDKNQYGIRHIQLNTTDSTHLVFIWKTKTYASNRTIQGNLRKLESEDPRKFMFTPACIEFQDNPRQFFRATKSRCDHQYQPNPTQIDRNLQLLIQQHLGPPNHHSCHRLIVKNGNFGYLASRTGISYMKGYDSTHLVMFIGCSPHYDPSKPLIKLLK